jgi:hypothetical protein
MCGRVMCRSWRTPSPRSAHRGDRNRSHGRGRPRRRRIPGGTPAHHATARAPKVPHNVRQAAGSRRCRCAGCRRWCRCRRHRRGRRSRCRGQRNRDDRRSGRSSARPRRAGGVRGVPLFVAPLFVVGRIPMFVVLGSLRFVASRALLFVFPSVGLFVVPGSLRLAVPGVPLFMVASILFVAPRIPLFMVASILFVVLGDLLFMAPGILRFVAPRVLRFIVPGILSMPARGCTAATGPTLVSRAAVRRPADCLIGPGAERQLPMVWLGRGGGDARQGKRTTTEDDRHHQPMSWGGGLRMFARVARHHKSVPISWPELCAPVRVRAPPRVSGRSRTRHPFPQTRRSSVRWVARRRSPAWHRRRAFS